MSHKHTITEKRTVTPFLSPEHSTTVTEGDSRGTKKIDFCHSQKHSSSTAFPPLVTDGDSNFNKEYISENKGKIREITTLENVADKQLEKSDTAVPSEDSHSRKPRLLKTPYTYQTIGAVQASWHGKTLIADEPGLGKTIQAIMCIQLMEAKRVLIVCPPTLTTNWHRETIETGILNLMPGNPRPTTQTITPRTKNTTYPDTGIIITSDTLLTSRPQLQQTLTEWKPTLTIFDEAHRYKNFKAKRTRMALTLAKASKKTICLTGTPIISSPLDVLPLLIMLKKTKSFPRNFVNYYTKEDYWGNRIPIVERLPELHALLEKHVWVRRTKQQVLKELPAKTRYTQWIDIDNKQTKPIMRQLSASLHKHLQRGYPLEDWIDQARQQVSGLRKATGLAKITAAVDWVENHWAGTRRPLLVWAHHTDVINQLHKEIQTRMPNLRVGKIYGATPQAERQSQVDAFQNGELDVLVLQIIAAGVGLTLTKASDALFVESDWTPANNVQAEDRIHRISQTMPVTITTLVANQTLDPVVHRILQENINVLNQVTPGSDHAVTDVVGGNNYVKMILMMYAKQILDEERTGN